VEALELHWQLDELWLQVLRADQRARGALDEVAGPNPFHFDRRTLTPAEEKLVFELTGSSRDLVALAVERFGESRIARLNYWAVDRQLELLALALEVHPACVLDAIEKWVDPPPLMVRDQAFAMVSWAVGRVFGVWPNPDELDEAPRSTRFIDGTPWARGRPENVHSHNLLGSSIGESRRVVALTRRVILDLASGDDWLAGIEGEFGMPLDTYLRERFFAGHLAEYSVPRRPAPIYWELAVPSRKWGMWVYGPGLNRETLFGIAQTARVAMSRFRTQAAQLRSDVENGGRGQRERLEAVDGLADELLGFIAKAEEIAQSGWEPEPSDGIILNAAPLESLFVNRKWKQAVSQQRKKMEQGEYPWATVQRQYFDRLKI
jgi:hypothetical protein